ncbi:uncharacterized protein LOC111626180 [Centruroides sculpturatus]|uniref:uncharacterized protein LOC111626180 n=2 Tax=Centruroides sculpturatus TaxID=218467 RepID=UPI000C6CB947|nr:uncharacterized protein LOC111626180 [Centruroides sculpturatus]XP_023225260.1 uncharacterized protein LOC111626180 [Centruroides sculpturatus]
MKICILFLLFGLASADIWQRAASTVDKAVKLFLEGVGQSGSLKVFIGLSDAKELNDIEDDIKEGLEKILKDELENIFQQIKATVENGKEVAEKLVEMVKDIKEKLKELKEDDQNSKIFLKKLKHLIKQSLKNFLENHGFGKRNLDQEMDHIARIRFSEFAEWIKKRVFQSEIINKIRKYIKNFITKNSELRKLKEVLLKLKEDDFLELLDLTFQSYNNKNYCDNKSKERINELFKDLEEDLREKAKKLQEFLKDRWLFGLEKLRSGFSRITALGIEIIGDGKDISVETARKAIEFFQEYKDDLGSLWDQINETTKSHIGQF